jgi:biopolymer transport protein ExbD
MAFSAGSSGGGLRGRRRFGTSTNALAEINIVPLVDVVLVLLIIFMLTAHVMDYGAQVDVPKTKITEQSNENLPVIVIRRDLTIRLNDKPVNIHDLTKQLDLRFKGKDTVFVAADGAIQWNVLAQVVAELSSAKIKPRLVTKPVEKGQ